MADPKSRPSGCEVGHAGSQSRPRLPSRALCDAAVDEELSVDGIGDAPLELLRNVRGIDLVKLSEAEECCGFGGTFAVKYPALSGAIESGFAVSRELLALGRTQDAQRSIIDVNELVMQAQGVMRRMLGPQVEAVMQKEHRGIADTDQAFGSH